MFAIPVSLAFAFPTLLNWDIQYSVSQQTTDRNARSELAVLFAAAIPHLLILVCQRRT